VQNIYINTLTSTRKIKKQKRKLRGGKNKLKKEMNHVCITKFCCLCVL